MQNYNIAIANDHAGFDLKLKILNHLQLKIIDFGCSSADSVDYPDYAKKVVTEIVSGRVKYGILICATGIGMSIAANRNTQIRAALCFNEFMAQNARAHNDANILVLGSKIIDEKSALKMIDIFLNTNFEGGRHSRRLDKLYV